MAPRLVTSANKIVMRDVVPGAQAATTLTLSSGAVVPVYGQHVIAAESGTTDDCDTITLTNLRALDVVEFTVDAGDTITFTHGVGNITTESGASIVATAGQTIRCTVNAAADGVVASRVVGSADPFALSLRSSEPSAANGALAVSDGTASTNGFGDTGAGVYLRLAGVWRELERVYQQQVFFAREDYSVVGDGASYTDTTGLPNGNGTDNATPLENAITAADNAGGGVVILPYGNIRLGGEIELPGAVRLVGQGEQTEAQTSGTVQDGTSLIGDHTSGAVIKVTGRYAGLSRLVIDASVTRRAGSAGSNYGVLLSAPDSAGADFSYFLGQDFGVLFQPNDNIHMSGGSTECVFERFFSGETGGHAFFIDDGTVLSRTNKNDTGQHILNRGVLWDANGHTLALGNTSMTYSVYRMILNNLDTFRGGLSGSVRFADANAYVNSVGSVFSVCAIGGSTAGSNHEMVRIVNRENRFINCRHVAGPTSAAGYVFDGAAAEGNKIEGGPIYGWTANPFLSCINGATNNMLETMWDTNVTTWYDVETDGIAGMKSVKTAAGDWTYGAKPIYTQPTSLIIKKNDPTLNYISLNDNQYCEIEFQESIVWGVLRLGSLSSALDGVEVEFRAGGTPFARDAISSTDFDASSNIGAAPGLSDVTAGKFKVLVHNTLPKIYICHNEGNSPRFWSLDISNCNSAIKTILHNQTLS